MTKLLANVPECSEPGADLDKRNAVTQPQLPPETEEPRPQSTHSVESLVNL